jgi:hypothetical protein
MYSAFLDELVSERCDDLIFSVSDKNSGGYDSSEISLN